MPSIFRRVSIEFRLGGPTGRPLVWRGADGHWNPMLFIDVPLIARLGIYYGTLDTESWASLGWTDVPARTILYFSADELLCAGIEPEALGLDLSREFHGQLDELGLGTLPSPQVLRLASWIEDTGADLPPDEHRAFQPARRHLGKVLPPPR